MEPANAQIRQAMQSRQAAAECAPHKTLVTTPLSRLEMCMSMDEEVDWTW